jgi:hypothetical protein
MILFAGNLLLFFGMIFCGKERNAQAKEVYLCENREELADAIAYSNDHRGEWVKITLTSSIEIDQAYEIKGKIKLLSQENGGYLIRRKDWKGTLFFVSGRLQLGNMQEENQVGIDGGARKQRYGKTLVEVEAGGALEMFAGSRLQYNYHRSDEETVFPRGGAVLVKSGGTFTMNGGTIQHCWSKNTKVLDVRKKNAAVGGGVAVESKNQNQYGSFFMHGGKISQCASQQGGGVFSCGKFVMDGGEICSNYADGKTHTNGSSEISYQDCVYNTGGGIKLQGYLDEDSPKSYARTEIRGGNICHNEAYNGGGIRITNGAILKILDGSIFGNQAAARGGGLDIGNGKYEDLAVTQVEISAGNITDCRAKNGGAGALSHGECYLKGLCTGNNEASQNGQGIYLSENGKLFMEGTTFLEEADDIYLKGKAYIRLSGELTARERAATICVEEDAYKTGKKIAQVTYASNASQGLYGDPEGWKRAHFVLKEKKEQMLLRPGDFLDTKRVEEEKKIPLSQRDIFISRAYAVKYEKNHKKEVTSIPDAGTKYWYEDYQIAKEMPLSKEAKFRFWYTKPQKKEKGGQYFGGDRYKENRAITLYAIWDYGMEIAAKENVSFYENQHVGKKELSQAILKLVDEEDGTVTDPDKITEKIDVREIKYQKAQNGYEPKKQIFSEDMGEAKLDTYFENLKKEEVVTATVLFAVRDSSGNLTQKRVPIKICYNHPPQLKVTDLTYYDFEVAQEWEKVKKELQQNGEASDKEDEILWGKKPQIFIKEPKSLNQEDFRIPAVYKICYEALDGLGKTTRQEVIIYVADSNPYAEEEKKYVRFISQKYLAALDPNSPWKMNFEQYQLLLKSLTSSKKDSQKIITITIAEDQLQ